MLPNAHAINAAASKYLTEPFIQFVSMLFLLTSLLCLKIEHERSETFPRSMVQVRDHTAPSNRKNYREPFPAHLQWSACVREHLRPTRPWQQQPFGSR